MRGRKTKGGIRYDPEEWRDIVNRSNNIGVTRAAGIYGVSEASIKQWRKVLGLEQNTGKGFAGSMDRYFCKRCQHGQSDSFTGCTYILDTGEKRPHRNGWCLGFCPREGVHQSTVEAYRRETKEHTGGESEEDDMNMMQAEMTDETIRRKKRDYTAAEKARILEYAAEHTQKGASEYFKVSEKQIWDWKKAAKAADTAADDTGYKKLTEDDVPVAVQDEPVPEYEDEPKEQEEAAAPCRPAHAVSWDETFASQLRNYIRVLELQLGKYRRMLDILERDE